MGPGAFDPGSPDHAILWVRIPRVLAALVVGAALAGAGLRAPGAAAQPARRAVHARDLVGRVARRGAGDPARRSRARSGSPGSAAPRSSARPARCVVVWRLARIGKHLPPATLVLAGVTMSMFCSSASVLIQYTSDFTEVTHMLQWMIGGMETVRLVTVGYAALPIGVALVVLIGYARELNALAAGPEVAASLGVAVGRTQTVIFVTASLLVGAAIAVVGADRLHRADRAARAARAARPRSPPAAAGVDVRRRRRAGAVRHAGAHGRAAAPPADRRGHRGARRARCSS